jgi:hypothetical protein
MIIKEFVKVVGRFYAVNVSQDICSWKKDISEYMTVELFGLNGGMRTAGSLDFIKRRRVS